MTDNFELFRGGDDDGGEPVDSDVALVSAYLAGELTHVQLLALEERLTADASFRGTMRPLFSGWAAPVASLVGARGTDSVALTPDEVDQGWKRFVVERDADGRARGAVPASSPIDTRTIAGVPSLTRMHLSYPRQDWRRAARVAAVTLLVVLPMLAIAQAVVAVLQGPTDGRGPAPRLVDMNAPSATNPATEGRSRVTLSASLPASPAQVPQALTLTRELVIRQESGKPLVSERGSVAILNGGSRAQYISIFAPDGGRVATLGPGSPDGLTIAAGSIWGWVGDSIWIAQDSRVSVVAITPRPTVMRTFTITPDFAGPAGLPPRKRVALRILRLAPDGSVVTQQAYPAVEATRTLHWPPPFGPLQAMFVRTNADARVVSVVPDFAHGRVMECSLEPAPGIAFTQPFCGRPDDAVSPDGRWFTHALSGGARDASGAPLVRVTTYGPQGDTVYSRQYPVVGVPIRRAEADAERVQLRERLARMRNAPFTDAETAIFNSAFRVTVPRDREPVKRVLVGTDGTVFVEIVGRAPHEWLVLDARGNVVGMVAVPGDITLSQVSRSAVWGYSSSAGETVRFRMGA